MNKSILLVEDQKSMRFVIANSLAKSYSITAIQNGLDAMAWLGSGNVPDAILLDINMPDMDGWQVLANLKASGSHRNIPVIIISGEQKESFALLAKDMGVKAFITKPFNPVQVVDQIDQLLSSKSPERKSLQVSV
jgi:two-component system, chemotaxis family, chemotaxis protein CheY